MKDPEAITQVIGRMPVRQSSSNDLASTPPSLRSSDNRPSATLPVAAQAKTLPARYGDRQTMLQTFGVANQMRYTKDEDRCYFGTAPTLGQVNAAYGYATSQEWLTYQLADLSEFSGARDKITASQINQLANIIADDYHWLKLTEVMLFFRKFKKGEYGRFYGSVDPITITQALREFIRDRNTAYHKHEQLERERREAEDRRRNPPCSREEYLERLKNLPTIRRMAGDATKTEDPKAPKHPEQ